MNLTCAQFSKKRSQHSQLRFIRKACAILCIFLLTAVPALAEPVTIKQVVQTLSSSQGAPDLRVNSLVSSQDPKGGTPQSGPRSETASTAPNRGAKGESIISGVTVTSDAQSIGVDITEEGEVEGTICDCGEILIAGGAFPKWPFLFLAAVPLVFINDCDDCNERSDSTPTPTPPSNPTPTPTPTPEPASLLLFGSGLLAAGAGLRRRYARTKLTQRKEEE